MRFSFALSNEKIGIVYGKISNRWTAGLDWLTLMFRPAVDTWNNTQITVHLDLALYNNQKSDEINEKSV